MQDIHKHSLALAIALGALHSAHAQDRHLREGDRAYDALAYEKAVTAYERAADDGAQQGLFAERLASSYYHLRDMGNAAKWYAVVVQQPSARPIDLYNYAQALRANGDNAGADRWLAAYGAQVAGDSRIGRQKDAVDYVPRLVRPEVMTCTVQDLPLNTAGADMCMAYHGAEVVFASDRAPDVAENRRHAWNGRPFLDLYSATVGADGVLGVPQPMSALNTRFHESNASFTPEGNTVYFTRNNFSGGHTGRNAQGVVNLTIYSRTFRNGKWSDERPFALNSDRWSVGHPSVSPDGQRIYFTSDMPGGKGGTDIWYCDRAGDGWGAPVNMGAEVNTEGNEMFPFADGAGQLYFASDGQAGLGGLDILVSRLNADGSVGMPVNPGIPLNSDHDDFGLVLDHDGMHGYFTSDRPGGQGGDDIYAVQWPGLVRELVEEMEKQQVLAARVAHPDGPGMAPAGVADRGAADPDRGASRDLPFLGNDGAGTGADGEDGHLELHIADATHVDQGSLVRDPGQGTPNEANGAGDASARGAANGPPTGKGKQFPYLNGQVDKAGTDHGRDGRVHLNDGTTGASGASALVPIYFDFAKWNIRADAVEPLDQVVNAMKARPSMRIELGGHTDDRGPTTFNLDLSRKRAESAANYLCTHGVERQRVRTVGHGEVDRDAAQVNEQEYQLDRRVDIIVTHE